MAQAAMDLWGTLQAKRLRLEGAVVLLALLATGLFGLTLWIVGRPVPVYYVPVGSGPGVLLPGELPDTLVAHLAARLLNSMYNVTPPTVAPAHQEVERYLHPRVLGTWRAQAAAEQQFIQERDISCLVSIRDTTVQVLPGGGRRVTLAALRQVYVGKVLVRAEDVQATVQLSPVPPGPLNPYGLVVTLLELTPPLLTPDRPPSGRR